MRLKINRYDLLLIGALVIVILYILIVDTKRIVLITGKSMEPAIHSGTIALIKRTDIKDINVDDIICFEENNEFIVHRVEEVYTNDNNELELRTKGDANDKIDSTVVNKDNYTGKLGISLWLTDIYLELLPKIFSVALVVFGIVTVKLRSKKHE